MKTRMKSLIRKDKPFTKRVDFLLTIAPNPLVYTARGFSYGRF
jgi:hypothetical protein